MSEHWDPKDGHNPYVDLPQMRMYAYEMGAGATAWAEDGEFNGFNLSEYFKASKADPTSKSTKIETGTYVFNEETRVSEFLEMLRGKLTEQMKVQLIGSGKKAPFPYESPDFTDAITHSVWYMADVASCFAMRDMLEAHPYFKGFVIHVAAGNKAGLGAAAKPPVEKAIKDARDQKRSGSITLSCGKLMTGVTIREWGAILMLRSLKSPESYFQSAFRVQSPWSYRQSDGSLDVQKETVYVFEFDPNRALSLVAEYGMKLATVGDDVTPQQAIGDLMNYLPIFQFSGGQMRQLDAADVLNIATTGVGASAPQPGEHGLAGRDLNEEVEAGRAREGQGQSRRRREEGEEGVQHRQEADPGEASEVPRQDPCLHVRDRLPRGSSEGRHRVAGHRVVHSGDRSDRRGLPAAQQDRLVQPAAHERCDLPVQGF